jgi:hypothetical protein
MSRKITYYNSGAQSIIYPADTYANMSFAFGLIKASLSYSGNCLEIQRDSDGAYFYVGWQANGIADLSGVLAWAGSDTVRVTIAYDSTGNGNNATNSNTATQSIIATGGVLNLYDNQLWLNANWYRIDTGGANTPYNAARLDTYMVYTPQSTSGQGHAIGTTCDNINSGFALVAQASSSSVISFNFGTPIYYQDGSVPSWSTRTDVRNSVVIPLSKTQISILNGSPSSGFSSTGINLGGSANFDFKLRGGYTCWGWVDNTSTDRAAIESLINDKVNITV